MMLAQLISWSWLGVAALWSLRYFWPEVDDAVPVVGSLIFITACLQYRLYVAATLCVSIMFVAGLFLGQSLLLVTLGSCFGAMILLLLRPTRTQSIAEAWLSTLGESPPVGLAFVDNEFRYVCINKTLARVNGVTVAEHLGKLVSQILPPQRWELIRPVLQHVRDRGEPITEQEFSGHIRSESGRYTHYRAAYYPVRDRMDQIIGVGMVVQDVTDQIQSKIALSVSEQRYRFLAETLPALVWSHLPDGTIDYYNRQLVTYTGLTLATSQQESWLAIVHPEDRETTREQWRISLQSGEPYNVQHRLRRVSDGAYRWHLCYAVPMRDIDNTIIRWYGACTDYDDLKRAEEALRENEHRKDEFLATLAHELRNPLAPIRTSLEVLRRHPHASVLEQARGLMERQVNQLVRLIDDLLDLGRLSKGKMTIQPVPVRTRTIVEHALETTQPVIDAVQQRVLLDLQHAPIGLLADPGRLSQVLGNLLHNASKFSPANSQICLKIYHENQEIIFCVADSGIGIPSEMLGRVFEMFTQVDQSLEKQYGGLGIGLTLARRLVEMHGGHIEAFSEGIGRGSEFKVHLPWLGEPNLPNLPTPTQVAGTPAAGPESNRILVVDDNRDAARTLAMLLGGVGYEVATAFDGYDALDLVPTFRPHLIFLDIGMPKLNGFDTARRLRKLPEAAELFIIALTGWGQEEDRRRSDEAGFDYHLTKPVDPEALLGMLEQWLPLGGPPNP